MAPCPPRPLTYDHGGCHLQRILIYHRINEERADEERADLGGGMDRMEVWADAWERGSIDVVASCLCNWSQPHRHCQELGIITSILHPLQSPLHPLLSTHHGADADMDGLAIVPGTVDGGRICNGQRGIQHRKHQQSAARRG